VTNIIYIQLINWNYEDINGEWIGPWDDLEWAGYGDDTVETDFVEEPGPGYDFYYQEPYWHLPTGDLWVMRWFARYTKWYFDDIDDPNRLRTIIDPDNEDEWYRIRGTYTLDNRYTVRYESSTLTSKDCVWNEATSAMHNGTNRPEVCPDPDAIFQEGQSSSMCPVGGGVWMSARILTSFFSPDDASYDARYRMVTVKTDLVDLFDDYRLSNQPLEKEEIEEISHRDEPIWDLVWQYEWEDPDMTLHHMDVRYQMSGNSVGDTYLADQTARVYRVGPEYEYPNFDWHAHIPIQGELWDEYFIPSGFGAVGCTWNDDHDGVSGEWSIGPEHLDDDGEMRFIVTNNFFEGDSYSNAGSGASYYYGSFVRANYQIYNLIADPGRWRMSYFTDEPLIDIDIDEDVPLRLRQRSDELLGHGPRVENAGNSPTTQQRSTRHSGQTYF